MGMTIAQEASTLGVSEKTIRRRIKSASINARMVGDPPHYEIEPKELGIIREPREKPTDTDQTNHTPPKPSVNDTLIETFKEQLREKDRQIKELHILLQGAQEQARHMLNGRPEDARHWWWPFG